jgi:hypothetical protein
MSWVATAVAALAAASQVAACGPAPAATPPPAGDLAAAAKTPPPPTAPARAAAWRLDPPIEFRGMCDASGAVALPGGRLAVIDDEVNQLVVYHDGGGEPLTRVPLDAVLGLRAGGPEADLEGVAVLDGDLVLMASHGRKRSGKPAPSRLRLARARLLLDGDGVALGPAGMVYTGLAEALIASPALAAYGLDAAAARSPKEPGGLNVEGLTGRGDDLLIGLRAPLFDGRALIVRLTELDAMFAGGEPTVAGHDLLDLGGRGVRAMSGEDDGILIAAGPPLLEPVGAAVFRWSAADASLELLAVELAGLNVEAIERLPGGDAILLSDDGERLVDGQPCKRAAEAARSFRGARLRAPR